MHFIFVLLMLILSSCGTKSKAMPYAALTPQEKARMALDAQDFPAAILLYKDIIAKEPLDYESYRFLSAAYAEAGGFDLLKAVSGTIGSDGSNMLGTLGDFLPKVPTDLQIESLRLATETLLSLPEEQRSQDHPEIPSASSALQQLQFYQAAYSLIYLNKFAKVSSSGILDPAQLETMTEADVENILDSFVAIATGAGGGVVAEAAEAFISELESMPGETRRDKLIAYLETHGIQH